MNIVIVYESLFGSTHEVADAVAEGAAQARPDATVTCLPVADATPERTADADLLLVGGPTHMHGMTSHMSRSMGLKTEAKEHAEQGTTGEHEPEMDVESPGLRDWFHDLPKAGEGRRAAAFDTRADFRLAGGAAKGIARRLHRHGYALAAEPEGFVIEDTEGPLRDGERDRARAWAADVVRAAAPTAAPSS